MFLEGQGLENRVELVLKKPLKCKAFGGDVESIPTLSESGEVAKIGLNKTKHKLPHSRNPTTLLHLHIGNIAQRIKQIERIAIIQVMLGIISCHKLVEHHCIFLSDVIIVVDELHDFEVEVRRDDGFDEFAHLVVVGANVALHQRE